MKNLLNEVLATGLEISEFVSKIHCAIFFNELSCLQDQVWRGGSY
jgi:hypothetical protein